MSYMNESSMRGTYVKSILHENESCHAWMSLVCFVDRGWWRCECMNASRYICRRYTAWEWVMSRINESCHAWMSLLYVGGDLGLDWSCECMSASRYMYRRYTSWEWVMSCMNESCHAWMSHVTHEWVYYVVAMISRLLTITGLFSRIYSLL